MKSMGNNTDAKVLREFGLLSGIILVLLFGLLLPWLMNFRFPVWPWIVATILLVFSILCPLVLRPIYALWMAFGAVMGWINTRLILGFVFYLVVAPIGLIMRLFGKDPLQRKFISTSASYRKLSKQHDSRHMEKPF